MATSLQWFAEVDSTNRIAREGDFGNGDVIASTNQTAGRGRIDRTWSMVPGRGLAMTVVLSRLAMGSPNFLSRLPLVVAFELQRVLDSHATHDNRPTIKWPNDVHFRGLKVAGILIETIDEDRLAVGIGINLSAIPDGISTDSATHLEREGIAITAEDLALRLTGAILHGVSGLDSDDLHADVSNAIDTVGRAVRVELPDGSVVTGRATGIGATGSLLVETADGITEFVAGDVTHLRLDGEYPHSVG